MAKGAVFFLNKTLGKDFMESLAKFELYKPGTRTVVDHEELRTALQIVPRTVMALLIKELTPMAVGENKDIELPVEGGAQMNVQKHERDVYTGKITQNNKMVVEFVNRAIPGVGLVVMSAFELYDVNQLADNMEPRSSGSDDLGEKVQKLVDERLALHDLIGKVIDKKLMEREAIDKLVLMKLTDAVVKEKKVSEITKLQEESTPQSEEYFRGMTNGMKVVESILTEEEPKFVEPLKKGHKKLQEFIELRKIKKNEFSIEMAKGETVECPDCGKHIFDGSIFSGCVCLGEDREKKVFIKKTEQGIKVRFGKGWDAENIEMLLDTLRKKRD